MAGIDANVILQGAALRKNNFDPIEIARLKTQMDQQKLQQAVTQFEFDKQQRADATQENLRSLLSQGGTPDELYDRLLRGGHLKEATDFQKSSTANKTAQLDQQTKIGGLVKQAASAVLANPTEQNALGVINQLEQQTGQRMDNDKAAVMSFRGDPNAIRRWAAGHALEAEKLLPKTENQDLGGQVESRQIDPLTGQPVGPAEVRQKTMTPDQIENNKIARDNLSVAQQRLALDKEKNTRESTAQQKLDLKMAADEKADKYRAGLEIQKNDVMLRTIDDVIKGTTELSSGIPGKVGAMIPGTSIYDLDKKIDTLKANIGFGALAQMREASKSGGALGQVAVKELEFLQATLGSLDIGQSKEQKLATLKEIKSLVENWNRQVKLHTGIGEKVFDSMPDPSKYSGKRIKADDGTIYKSNGTSWVRQ